MRVMKSMELDEIASYDAPLPLGGPKPRFPYGLRICLTDEEFKKLDLDPSEAEIGGLVHLHAMARITSVSANSDEDGDHCRVELQIEDLDIESEDAENKGSK